MQTRRIPERGSVAERIAKGQAEKAQEAEADAALRAAQWAEKRNGVPG